MPAAARPIIHPRKRQETPIVSAKPKDGRGGFEGRCQRASVDDSPTAGAAVRRQVGVAVGRSVSGHRSSIDAIVILDVGCRRGHFRSTGRRSACGDPR